LVYPLDTIVPGVEVLGITDPECSSALGLVEPLVQTVVKKLSMFQGEFLFVIGSAAEADVGVNIAVVGFVLDFAVKLHTTMILSVFLGQG